jgi:hypothetical protein
MAVNHEHFFGWLDRGGWRVRRSAGGVAQLGQAFLQPFDRLLEKRDGLRLGIGEMAVNLLDRDATAS